MNGAMARTGLAVAFTAVVAAACGAGAATTSAGGSSGDSTTAIRTAATDFILRTSHLDPHAFVVTNIQLAPSNRDYAHFSATNVVQGQNGLDGGSESAAGFAHASGSHWTVVEFGTYSCNEAQPIPPSVMEDFGICQGARTTTPSTTHPAYSSPSYSTPAPGYGTYGDSNGNSGSYGSQGPVSNPSSQSSSSYGGSEYSGGVN